MSYDLVWYCLLMFAATVAGGIITLVRRWSDERLHLFLSFGAGIFLGAVFYHLLPEVMHQESMNRAGLFILAGYLLIFFVERILLHSGEGHAHGHLVVSITVLIGLSVHSLMEGLGLAVAMTDPELGRVLFISILAHKVPAALSLVSLMVLAGQSRRRIWFGLLFFAATAPIGALVLAPIVDLGSPDQLWQITGIVTGSFLYVATADLLPEVFHTRDRRWVNLLLMLAGIMLMSLLSTHSGHN
ncbi:MAG: ZIP family metal transporter [Candidatus Zixiibacteriota bacterium]